MKKSESIKEISSALVIANKELKNVTYDSTNPFFKSKYASLAHILDTVRPIMTKNGLSVIQEASRPDDGYIDVNTLLTHSSGEWIETVVNIAIGKRDGPQGVGIAITYGRRYAISALLNISSEEDNDGNDSEKKEDKKNYDTIDIKAVTEILKEADNKRTNALYSELKTKHVSYSTRVHLDNLFKWKYEVLKKKEVRDENN